MIEWQDNYYKLSSASEAHRQVTGESLSSPVQKAVREIEQVPVQRGGFVARLVADGQVECLLIKDDKGIKVRPINWVTPRNTVSQLTWNTRMRRVAQNMRLAGNYLTSLVAH